MLSDGYVKYEEAEVHRSAIMQDFRENEILFYIHGVAILHFFELSEHHKITKIQNVH